MHAITRPFPSNVLRLIVGVVALVLVSGCGSTTTSSAGSGIPGVPGQTGSQFSQIQAQINKGKGLTFKAVYTSQSSDGSSSTTTIEQKSPKTLFGSNGSTVIFDGTTTHECSDGQCTSLPGSTNPLSSVAELYSGTYILSLMQAYQNTTVLSAEGVTVKYSSATYAGQPSTCMAVTVRPGSASAAGGGAKWCVTNEGILAYSGGGSGSGSNATSGVFELTSFTTNVPDSDFQIPADSSGAVPIPT